MRTLLLCLLAVAVVVSGCSSTARQRVVRISLAGNRFVPNSVSLRPGERILFVFANHDPTDHEFVLGDTATQREHSKNGAMAMHHELGESSRAVPKSQTVNFAWTAPDKPGELIIGCHVGGHYEAGMRGTITIS